MGKAKADRTPEPLPLDDARWVLITVIAKERLIERLGSGDDAVRDLEQAMVQKGLRCMARSKDTGARKLLPPAMWETITITWRGQYGVIAEYRKQPGDHTWRQFMYRLFVWLPDVDRLWPPVGSAPVDHDNTNTSDTPPRVRPGPKPHTDWQILIARWLIEVQGDDPQRLQNIDALVVEAQSFLDNQPVWSPSDPKVLRAKIRELLTPVRR